MIVILSAARAPAPAKTLDDRSGAGDPSCVAQHLPDLIRAWWSFRSLIATRWPAEKGSGSPAASPEVAVLRSRP